MHFKCDLIAELVEHVRKTQRSWIHITGKTQAILKLAEHGVSHLVPVVDIWIRQSPRHQFIEHHSIAIHIRLEGVWVSVLHSDHLRGLKNNSNNNMGGLLCDLRRVMAITHHPQDGATGLFNLLRATPARLDRGQPKVTDLNRPALVQEDIWRMSSGDEHSTGFNSRHSFHSFITKENSSRAKLINNFGSVLPTIRWLTLMFKHVQSRHLV